MTDRDKTPGWEGHKAATSAELLNVMTVATTGSARLSRADRILFTVCEFWAAARNNSLVSQLAEDADSQLRAAETAFAALGLVKAGSIVRCARTELAQSKFPDSLRRVVENLENALAEDDEPIDQRIADFADQQARERTGLPP